jgi:hypothetical protein
MGMAWASELASLPSWLLPPIILMDLVVAFSLR